MKSNKRTVRTSRGIKEYTYLGCPLTRNRSAWCYRICPPDLEGKGRCGRIAPHSLMSSTQMAILKYKRKQLLQHFEKLENMYLAEPCSKLYAPGIKISSGETEILIPYNKKFKALDGFVHSSVLSKVLTDAARYAVTSFFDRVLIGTASFTTLYLRPAASGDLIAKGRFIGASGGHLLAEAVVTDSEGSELARGNGTFIETEFVLTPKSGYKLSKK